MLAPSVNLDSPLTSSRVLGVNFFCGSLDAACVRAAEGGLLTAPSGPGLACDLLTEPVYRRALERSDIVLTDSAFMVLLWRLRTGRRLPRNSGLAFLRIWMNRAVMRTSGSVLWVMPDDAERQQTYDWLIASGHSANAEDFYVACRYGPGEVADERLRLMIEARRPEIIYLGIGGGVQERLGLYLRESLTYRPLILCLGAAIAFITGAQVRISPWVDRCGLGWLWRILSNPSRFGPRYLRAMRLAWMIFRFGDHAPPLLPAGSPQTTA